MAENKTLSDKETAQACADFRTRAKKARMKSAGIMPADKVFKPGKKEKHAPR